jgi:cytochrome c2
MRHPTIPLAALAATLLLSATAAAQDIPAFYENNCAPCHTIGEGAQAGPDLNNVTARRSRDWLIRFMLDPEAFASDPEVLRMIDASEGLTMPATEGLTREIAEKLLDLIEARSKPEPGTEPTAELLFTPADIERGRALFTGAERLSSRGAACIACHDAAVPAPGGGLFGPDLRAVHSRLGGRRGVTAWLAGTPTPVMRALYRTAPLSAEETTALAAFLEQPGGAPDSSRVMPLLTLGLGGALAFLIAAGLIGAGRFTSLRRPLVERAATAGTPAGRNSLGAAPAPVQDIDSGGRR